MNFWDRKIELFSWAVDFSQSYNMLTSKYNFTLARSDEPTCLPLAEPTLFSSDLVKAEIRE